MAKEAIVDASQVLGKSLGYLNNLKNNRQADFLDVPDKIQPYISQWIRDSHRKFIELVTANFSLAEDAYKIDESLSGLKWITPHYLYSPSDEINLLIDTKNILLKANEKKIIITDYQFFSSLINNKFASPNKWYDDLSIPEKNSKYYDKHKKFFLNKITKNKIKYLYFVGKNKNEMYFFEEFISENKCIIPKQLNELLLEFDISQCKF